MLKKIIGPMILGLAGCAALVSLSVWQVERLAWKENLIAQTQAAMDAPPRKIDDIDWNKVTDIPSGTPFEVSGTLLDNFTDKLSGAGYNRIIPFETGGHVILMEIGFVDQFKKADEFDVPSDAITIQGRAYVPADFGSLDAGKNIWVGYNLAGLAEQLNTEPFLLIANESPIDGIETSPYTIDLPNNHLQYAITWGLLALAWGAMTIYWGYSRIRTRKIGK